MSTSTEPGTPPPNATQRKAQREGKWALLGFGGSQMLRLGSNLILTRLLPREAFGIFLVVRFVLLASGRFSDVGVGASIIQNKREDARFLNTAWTLQIGRGVLLTVVATAVAWPAAVFFEMPVLFGLIPFAGLVGVVTGFNSTKLFTLNRKLNIKRLTGIEFGSQVLGSTATLLWAFLHPTVWALAAGGVVAAVGKALLSHTAVPGLRNRLLWDRDAARELFSFGKWVFLSTILGFAATQADRVVFGRLFPAAELGVYAIAVLIAFTPQQVFRHLTLSVSFPLYSQTFRDGGDLPRVFRAGRTRVLLLAGVVCSLMLGGGPTLIDFLYPEEYAAAGWMVQLLAIGTWFNALEVTLEAASLARGESRPVAIASAVKIAVMTGMIIAGYIVFGIPGAIAGFSLSEISRYAILSGGATRAGLKGLPQELRHTAAMVAVGGLAYLATTALRGAGVHIIVELAALGLVVLAGWLPLGWPVLKRLRSKSP